ncbi:hypothetical protein SAMN02990966_05934 [Rhodospirillales bacterium URHD0017]|nr:hypothetical protein SAMN02990966_05934 [Rhodospirillales bacterium URHD0017]
MLTLSLDRENKVLLATFSGVFGKEALSRHDAMVGRFVATHDGRFRGIADFLGIERVDVSLADLTARGRQPPITDGKQRVYVAATTEMFGLCRMFSTYQGLAGHAEPKIAKTLVEACEILGLDNPVFEPVDW